MCLCVHLDAQWCPILCDPLDCNPPGSYVHVHGISQARILGWVAISSSKRSSQSRDQTHISPVFYTAGGFFTCWVMEEAQELPYDPSILLLGIYSEKTIIGKDTCTPMITAVLFIIEKTWKQPKRPSDRWMDKDVVHIYNGILFSHKQGWDDAIWMGLQIIKLSEVSQKKTTIIW